MSTYDFSPAIGKTIKQIELSTDSPDWIKIVFTDDTVLVIETSEWIADAYFGIVNDKLIPKWREK